MNFGELEQLMSSRGVTALAEIARALNTTPQAVSNWKARDQIPYHIVDKLKSNIESVNNRPLIKDVNNIPNYFYEEKTITLSGILYILARQIKTIFVITFSIIFLTFLYVQFIDKEELLYISSTKILMSEPNSSSSGLGGLASQFGVNINQPSASELSSVSLFPELIYSRVFAERILKKSFFTKRFGQKLSLLAILTHGLDPPKVGKDTLMYRAMKSFQGMVEFEVLSSYSLLKCETFEPTFSRDLANEVLFEFEQLNLTYRNRGVLDKREFILKRISAVEDDLENSEETLKRFREQNRQVNSPALQLEQERLLRDLEIQKGIYLTLKQQLEMTKIEEIQKTSIIQILDYPQIPLEPSNRRNKIFTLLLVSIIGLGFGITISLSREYIEHSNIDERKKLRQGKRLLIKKTKSLYSDKRISGILSLLFMIGLPFFLGHNSENPEFFGKYSTQAIIINLFYISILIFSLVLYRMNSKNG